MIGREGSQKGNICISLKARKFSASHLVIYLGVCLGAFREHGGINRQMCTAVFREPVYFYIASPPVLRTVFFVVLIVV
jgi:hypothetical protein